MNLTIDEIMMFAPGGAGRAKKNTQTDNMFAYICKTATITTTTTTTSTTGIWFKITE
jgi:hypothetical protein